MNAVQKVMAFDYNKYLSIEDNNIHLYFDYSPNYSLANHYKAIIKTKGKINIEEFEPHIHSQVTHEERLGNIGNINYESYSKEYRFPTHTFLLGLLPHL